MTIDLRELVVVVTGATELVVGAGGVLLSGGGASPHAVTVFIVATEKATARALRMAVVRVSFMRDLLVRPKRGHQGSSPIPRIFETNVGIQR